MGTEHRSHEARFAEFRPRHFRRRLIVTALVVTDLVMSLAAMLFATWLRFGSAHSPVWLHGMDVGTDYYSISIATALLIPAFLAYERLYDLDSLFWGSGEFSRVVHAATLATVLMIITSYMLRIDNISRLWQLYAWILLAIMLAAGRWAFRLGLRSVRRRGQLLRPTLVVGCNRDAAHMAQSLAFDHSSGLVAVGCVASDPREVFEGSELIRGVPVIGHVGDLATAVEASGCDAIVIVSSAFEHATVSRIVSALRRMPVDVHLSSGLFDVLTARVLVREVAGTPIMMVRGTTLSPRKVLLKRVFDVVFSSLVVLAGMPAWIAIALAIKLDSPGPVFYHQRRVGKGGSLFGMYKFRSMYVDADKRLAELQHSNEADGPLFKMRDDPRVTPVGKFIRKYSIDEFPQFLNVLRGQMSVVGPRPPLPAESEQYDTHHAKRLDVLPGVTGLWQVSGRSDLTFDEMIRLDLYYIENWSLRYDLALVLRTIPSVVFANGAY